MNELGQNLRETTQCPTKLIETDFLSNVLDRATTKLIQKQYVSSETSNLNVYAPIFFSS